MLVKPVTVVELFLVDPDLECRSAEGVIEVLCKRMEEMDYVDSSYAGQVIQREKKFPTGLPTLPYGTAIPHGDSTGVKRTGVAVAVLHDAVPFQAMDAPDETIDVNLVFLLAMANPSKQVVMLQWVGEIVQNQKVLEELVAADTPHDGIEIIKPFFNQTLTNEDKG